MGAGTIPDAVRDGDPAVITVGVILLLLAVVVIWLARARRPTAPKRGALTVDKLKARLAKEAESIQSKIDEARRAEFTRLAEETAQRRLDEDTQVMDRIPAATQEERTVEFASVSTVAVPQQQTRLSRKRRRPYTGLTPRPRPTPRPKSLV
ncbi:hypothetical protein AB0878_44760 [Amycolatopsis sp. NPDC047767]|uniref:hypothetical protein n=1 Tax=Amycolatopsis sp. NPDC047767 TaxID=3156765 RepID=UPI0034535629